MSNYINIVGKTVLGKGLQSAFGEPIIAADNGIYFLSFAYSLADRII
jgi:hypothetical protein